MSLDLIIGPMFSGKTTYLLNRLNQYSSIDLKCLYINSLKDSREEEDYSTHNPVIGKIGNISSIKVDDMSSVDVTNFDVIGIDEYGLFNNHNNLLQEWVERLNKKIIVCGLSGDYKRRKFGYIIDLIPICDSVKVLTSFCQGCKDNSFINKALFSKRISEDENIVCVGKDNYIPVCRHCYLSD